MCSGVVLIVNCWRYRMPFDANVCVSTLVKVDWIKWMYFCVKQLEVGVNDSIFSGNDQRKVYFKVINFHLNQLSSFREQADFLVRWSDIATPCSHFDKDFPWKFASSWIKLIILIMSILVQRGCVLLENNLTFLWFGQT